ncbi:Methyltransferase FkbM [Aphelenchoides avenae]|nr:Methyltransferase FkbM [Aphelenchus avenae]
MSQCCRYLLSSPLKSCIIAACVFIIVWNLMPEKPLERFANFGESQKAEVYKCPDPRSSRFPELFEDEAGIFTKLENTIAAWQALTPPMDQWLNTTTLFNSAWKPYLTRMSPLVLRNTDENKFFVEFLGSPAQCNIITMGVGFDTSVEEKFLHRHPGCRFVAVDPTDDRNQALVEKLNGTFVKGAIGGTTGTYAANVFERGKVTIDHIGLVEFMEKYNGKRAIDWLNVDVERAELGVLQAIRDNYDALPPICQMNVEVHYPPSGIGGTELHGDFIKFFPEFLRDRRFLLLNVELPDSPKFRFLRMYFINVHDEECIRKFIC